MLDFIGLIQPRQLKCWVEHCRYAHLLGRKSLTQPEYDKMMKLLVGTHKQIYAMYKDHLIDSGKKETNLDGKPNFHQGDCA